MCLIKEKGPGGLAPGQGAEFLFLKGTFAPTATQGKQFQFFAPKSPRALREES
jgi:hypothetical protein